MLGFYKVHPEFKERPLFLTGESYAGKYLPNFAKSIFDYNEKHEDDGLKINVKAILVADPYINPIVERL